MRGGRRALIELHKWSYDAEIKKKPSSDAQLSTKVPNLSPFRLHLSATATILLLHYVQHSSNSHPKILRNVLKTREEITTSRLF